MCRSPPFESIWPEELTPIPCLPTLTLLSTFILRPSSDRNTVLEWEEGRVILVLTLAVSTLICQYFPVQYATQHSNKLNPIHSLSNSQPTFQRKWACKAKCPRNKGKIEKKQGKLTHSFLYIRGSIRLYISYYFVLTSVTHNTVCLCITKCMFMTHK